MSPRAADWLLCTTKTGYRHTNPLKDSPSLFEGLAAEELTLALARGELRRFSTGETIVAEGERAAKLYVILSGSADVFVADGHGSEYQVNRVDPGETLGEMSLLTGEPASATARAATDVEVLVLSEAEFTRLATTFPRMYHNLGALLARKLFHSDRRLLRPAQATALLVNTNAPSLVGYALACSIAWHTRESVVLVAVDENPDSELSALGSALPAKELAHHRVATKASSARADLLLAHPQGALRPEQATRTIEALRQTYDHVLVQASGVLPGVPARRIIHLRAPGTTPHTPTELKAGYAIEAWVDRGADRRRAGDAVRVSTPVQADEHALRLGILPTTTAAGESLGWVARDLTGLKVGLALGGGGVKGYAHVGVLRALERAGLRFDYLAGTSIGAAVAGLYALGHQPESIPRILDLVGTGLFRPTVSRHGLLSDVGVRSLLEKIGGAERIEDLRLPLGVVAADLGSGREVVFRSGLLWPAVLASIAIPGVYPAQVMGNHTLIDGGVLNPVPTDVAAEMGADIVIGVNLRNRLVLGRDISEARVPAGPKPTMLDVLTRTLELLQSKLAPEEESPSLILLRPDFPDAPGWGLRRFSDGRRYIEVGERATQAALPRIAARLPWLRT